ncbi:hypothetical protein GQS_02980 [Thermococcus sp. 4557]|uniref:hypothetical protein n=1 Tax=Thermococcus sp. (strain CGMCC 1.5172 / 4557) TaxID=1042877 RepID=UPI000219EF33|nr:hypothetical protein [Thermococcus sp. 4557]AEK72497.1 hypothetical protein GQS_02980 [Thermococcus sp. 4557]
MSRRGTVLLIIAVGILVGALVALRASTPTNTPENVVSSGCFIPYSSSLDGHPLFKNPDGSEVYNTPCGYVIKRGDSAYIINASKAFFFDWGFIAVGNTTTKRTVPIVLYQIDANSVVNISVRSVTSDVSVKVLTGCTYDGKQLWIMEFDPYLWSYSDARRNRVTNGTAYPELLFTQANGYLYLLAYQTSSSDVQDFRTYAPNDYFYIIGENGTVEKFDLGGSTVPIRNTFLVSNGSYVLMGFEKPQLDGSPRSGYVMILNGTEVLFRRSFQMNDPTCLCHVIPGWGRIDEKGCAVFGLYTGEGRYCNGEFTYVANSTG